MGVASRKRAAMESLCDEVLALILKKLLIPDVVRARAVCKRWRARADAERAKFDHFWGYCPLVFQRHEDHHTWSGFHSATGKWESLPSLTNLPKPVHLVPISGSGAGLLGFKVSQQYSGYVVGNPYSRKWMTLPKSPDSWGSAAMFMATTTTGAFRVVAVREDDTHLYKSEDDKWKKLGCRTPSGQSSQAVERIRSKSCAAVNNRLYTTDGKVLVSFDMRSEQWCVDGIHIPIAKHAMELVECAGRLYAVTEEEDSGRISLWSFEEHEFCFAAEMPPEIRECLKVVTRKGRSRVGLKLRSVGYGQQLFFWRHKRLVVVSFDLFTHEWGKLPEIVKPDIVAAGDPPQVTIDVGFFEPKFEVLMSGHCNCLS